MVEITADVVGSKFGISPMDSIASVPDPTTATELYISMSSSPNSSPPKRSEEDATVL